MLASLAQASFPNESSEFCHKHAQNLPIPIGHSLDKRFGSDQLVVDQVVTEDVAHLIADLATDQRAAIYFPSTVRQKRLQVLLCSFTAEFDRKSFGKGSRFLPIWLLKSAPANFWRHTCINRGYVKKHIY